MAARPKRRPPPPPAGSLDNDVGSAGEDLRGPAVAAGTRFTQRFESAVNHPQAPPARAPRSPGVDFTPAYYLYGGRRGEALDESREVSEREDGPIPGVSASSVAEGWRPTVMETKEGTALPYTQILCPAFSEHDSPYIPAVEQDAERFSVARWSEPKVYRIEELLLGLPGQSMSQHKEVVRALVRGWGLPRHARLRDDGGVEMLPETARPMGYPHWSSALVWTWVVPSADKPGVEHLVMMLQDMVYLSPKMSAAGRAAYYVRDWLTCSCSDNFSMLDRARWTHAEVYSERERPEQRGIVRSYQCCHVQALRKRFERLNAIVGELSASELFVPPPMGVRAGPTMEHVARAIAGDRGLVQGIRPANSEAALPSVAFTEQFRTIGHGNMQKLGCHYCAEYFYGLPKAWCGSRTAGSPPGCGAVFCSDICADLHHGVWPSLVPRFSYCPARPPRGWPLGRDRTENFPICVDRTGKTWKRPLDPNYEPRRVAELELLGRGCTRLLLDEVSEGTARRVHASGYLNDEGPAAVILWPTLPEEIKVGAPYGQTIHWKSFCSNLQAYRHSDWQWWNRQNRLADSARSEAEGMNLIAARVPSKAAAATETHYRASSAVPPAKGPPPGVGKGGKGRGRSSGSGQVVQLPPPRRGDVVPLSVLTDRGPAPDSFEFEAIAIMLQEREWSAGPVPKGHPGKAPPTPSQVRVARAITPQGPPAKAAGWHAGLDEVDRRAYHHPPAAFHNHPGVDAHEAHALPRGILTQTGRAWLDGLDLTGVHAPFICGTGENSIGTVVMTLDSEATHQVAEHVIRRTRRGGPGPEEGNSIFLSARTFNLQGIVNALREAHAGGATITVMVDRSSYSNLENVNMRNRLHELRDAGICVRTLSGIPGPAVGLGGGWGMLYSTFLRSGPYLNIGSTDWDDRARMHHNMNFLVELTSTGCAYFDAFERTHAGYGMRLVQPGAGALAQHAAQAKASGPAQAG